jgi:hypothetical protein
MGMVIEEHNEMQLAVWCLHQEGAADICMHQGEWVCCTRQGGGMRRANMLACEAWLTHTEWRPSECHTCGARGKVNDGLLTSMAKPGMPEVTGDIRSHKGNNLPCRWRLGWEELKI